MGIIESNSGSLLGNGDAGDVPLAWLHWAFQPQGTSHLPVTGNNTEMCLKITSCLMLLRRNKQGGLDYTSEEGFM